MSSILKALKQLESESDAQRPAAGLPGAWRARPAASDDPPPPPPKKVIRRPIIGAAIAIGVAILAAIFLFGGPARKAPDTGAVAYRVSAPVPPPPLPAEPPRPAQRRPMPETNTLPQGVGDRPPPPGAQPPPAPRTLPQQEPQSVPPPAPPRPQEAPPPAARRPLDGADSATRRPGPEAAAPEPAPSRTPPGPPERSDPRISVQAIAWSREPAQRMAVVNGNIMLEGESVEGIEVKTIEEDGIVFTEAGRWWKQGP